MTDASPRTTQLLNRLGAGDRSVEKEILDRTYAELVQLAAASMRSRSDHTLQPTALVHEAWMRLVDQSELHFKGQQQFFALASRVMRSVLVDHYRAKNREKRGGAAERVSLTLHEATETAPDVDVLALEDALERLEQVDPELCRVVEMRFFAGLSHPEISKVTGIALRTVERRWRQARAWLQAELGAENG